MSGPRILPVSDPTDEQRELLTTAGPTRAKPGNIFATIVHHPDLFKRFSRFGGYLLVKGKLPARDREVVILRVGWRSGSVYEFGQHTLIGGAAGLTDAEIAALASEEGEWEPGDAALVAMADDLCATNTVSDATWAALADRWNEAELIELLMVAGFYRLVSGFLNATGVELDEGVPSWPGT
jgi:alkylhydroperoxidase family enzyme